VAVGGHTGAACRILSLPTFPAARKLQMLARALETSPPNDDDHEDFAPPVRDGAERWRREVRALVGWGNPEARAWPLGQTAGMAASVRDRYGSVARFVRAVLEGTADQVRAAAAARVLGVGATLAQAHGTRYPIVQGPMTRVSDRPEFALEVSRAGALPMMALALSTADQARDVLSRTAALLGDRPWGVGILGFVPPSVREAQMAEVLRVRPRFALIAGGRPDQSAALDAAGIETYLHVPAPSLLRAFLDQGARRFVFEGRECGGHVGPLGSFILWEQAVDVLLEVLAPGEHASILFAGGIHDARSAAMVSALSVRLAERGIRVGVLMGTAYLFTREAVSSGAIVPGFQEQALKCRGTVMLESAVGHANRCAHTPFARRFNEERVALLRDGLPPESVAERLDNLILGRLRVATRGLQRGDGGALVEMDGMAQETEGMYMMGEVAALRSSVLGMETLHEAISVDALDRYLAPSAVPAERSAPRPEPCEVAIVGIGLRLPGAESTQQYWDNILNRRCAITEVPENRWDLKMYFSADRQEKDGIYSRWGGWLRDMVFDPLRYGIPPNRWDSIMPGQTLSLEVAHQALVDAGFERRDFDREHTSVVVAAGDHGLLGGLLIFRSFLPMVARGEAADLMARLPNWNEDMLPGVLPSVCSGRLANRFDLGGSNFIVDAACASSLTAVDMACHELTSGRANMVLAGAVDMGVTPFDYLAFSRVGALSPSGRVRPFDREADGIVISEGVAFMVLKRLADAERDGDRIYAVIRGVGSSSDGRTMGLTAPDSHGQQRALERAYARSGASPASIGMYEAHGTGTAVGDRTELETISSLMIGASPASCCVGSVKSLLGHTKRVAGLAALTKAALSLYHRVQPPHLGVENPLDPLLEPTTPLFLRNEPRPWLSQGGPRRAGVSAFGFGGTNAHVVIEEHRAPVPRAPGAGEWPAELILLEESSREELLEATCTLQAQIEGKVFRLSDLACTLALRTDRKPTAGHCAALVVRDQDNLRDGLARLQAHLEGSPEALPEWILVERRDGVRPGQVAFLFPGQGALYADPCLEATLFFTEMREAIEHADRFLADRYAVLPSALMYPAAGFTPEQSQAARDRLLDTHVAQPAIGALSTGWAALASRLGLRADCVAGHSYGEFSALHAAGVLSDDDFLTLSEARGRAMREAALQNGDAGAMAAVTAPRAQVEGLLSGADGVYVANCNTPSQTVISGDSAAVRAAVESLREAGLRAIMLPVAGAFHSPLMQAAQVPLAQVMRGLHLQSPAVPVYSNVTGNPYPEDPAAILDHMQHHLLGSVEFVSQVRNMRAEGVRTFIEMGPGAILTGLVDEILDGADHLAIALDTRATGLRGLLLALAKLRCAGVPWQAAALFEQRMRTPLDLRSLPLDAGIPRAAWIVNPLHTRLAGAPVQASGGTSIVLAGLSDAEETPPPQREKPVARASAPPEVRIAAANGPTKAAPPPVAPAPPLVPPALTSAPVAGLSDQASVLAAYQSYQETMRQFLRTQEQVMACFLNGARPAALPANARLTFTAPAAPAPAPALVAPVSAPPAPPPAEVPASRRTPPAAVSSPTLDLQGVIRALVRIVSDRTGYPSDMLGLELDIEAQLGIDSIKRVEITEEILKLGPAEAASRVRGKLDDLIRRRTLQGLADAVWGLWQEDAPAPEARALPAAAPRWRMEARDPQSSRRLPPRGLYLITRDRLGVAPLLEDLLARHGLATAVVPDDLSDLDALLAGHPRLGGIVHLAPLADLRMPSSFDAWRRECDLQVVQLYRLLQRCGKDRMDGALALSATRLGGAYGRDGADGPGLPVGGGAVALLRSVAAESGLRALSVDFEGAASPAQMAERLLDELHFADAESGWPGGRRVVYRAVEAPLEERPPALEGGPGGADGSSPRVRPLQVQADWVILATGGAQGITAEIARTMVVPGTRVVVVGRSAADAEHSAEISTPAEIRASLIERARRDGDGRPPAALEQEVYRIVRERAAAENLRRLREAGAVVEYHALDVRDGQAVQALLSDIYARHGRIDAVLHGAGVIEDRLLEDKSEASFDRVFGTKVDSTYHLWRCLRPQGLRLVLLFSSVAGRFGNRGQCDYGAANEVLNRMAWRMRAEWPETRVISVNWGPWRGTGMALEGVQQQLQRRSIEPIEMADGLAFARREMACGALEDAEIVAGQGRWNEILDSVAAGKPTPALAHP